jgi:hypothetical protein
VSETCKVVVAAEAAVEEVEVEVAATLVPWACLPRLP